MVACATRNAISSQNALSVRVCMFNQFPLRRFVRRALSHRTSQTTLSALRIIRTHTHMSLRNQFHTPQTHTHTHLEPGPCDCPHVYVNQTYVVRNLSLMSVRTSQTHQQIERNFDR